ncbi:MAG TPA: hypothetical protein VJM83_00545 [Nitrospirota bacterium]|nr:hypothetical protein [Nitrospirota bacterium]
MRKLTAAAAAFFAVVLIAAAALAADAGYTVRGEVVSIDPAGKTVVINTAEGEKTVVFQEGVRGFTDLKPGMSVEMTCIDMEGRSCAKDVKVISVAEATKPTQTFEGEVVSIDPGGKTIVIKSAKGEEMTMQVMTPTVERMVPKPGAPATEKMVEVEQMPVTEIKPGMMLRVDCFDSEGKFCAKRITVIPPSEAGVPVQEFTGEIVSIDPAGKSVVIKTATEEKTLYYQESTAGLPLDKLETGKKVKAYCLDVVGKSCIREINEQPEM